MASVLIPVGYLVIVLGSLLLFSNIYRKRNANKVLDPYFPSHTERNAYITLLGQTNPPTSESLLKSALVRRAMTDVQRLTRIREDKPALQGLLQKGSVGDDLWTSFQAAEKEIESEIVEVMHEANSFVEGWGQLIFQTAQEMLVNEKMRAVFDKTGDSKADLEIRYGTKAKFATEVGPTIQITSNPPEGAQKIASASMGAPPPPTTSNSQPSPPQSAASSNGLAPPQSAGLDGHSDSEHGTSPSKKSQKKGKKRK